MQKSKIVSFGEIMMRLSAQGFQRLAQAQQFDIHFGGSEANVTTALAHWGVSSAHVTSLPDHALGHKAANYFKQFDLDTSHIAFNGERIGIYFVEKGSGVRPTKVVYDRSHSSFSTAKPQTYPWETILANASWFHITGISPAISETAFLACLEACTLANKLGLKVSIDVGYRSNLWQWGKSPSEIMPQLVALAHTIVCSSWDSAAMFGLGEPGQNFAEICALLYKRFPNLQQILTTTRTQLSASHNQLTGHLWQASTGQVLDSPTIDIPDIVDRIGGGDAFMAGYIYGVVKQMPAAQALHFAVAASVLKHTIEGDINQVSVAEVQNLVQGDASGRLNR
jgi:2-dehydro-3-deoxygluconokinase